MRVQVPDLGIVVFPDDTPPETVEAAIRDTLRERRRDQITAEVEAKTATAEPSDTLTKAAAAYGAAGARAISDPIIGARHLLQNTLPAVQALPGWAPLSALSELVRPLSEAASEAEQVARETKGNELVSEVAGAIGSGVGSSIPAFVPGVGPILSAETAGLQSYESTRREALQLAVQAGVVPEQAEKMAHRVAMQSGLITGGVTGLFNRYAHAMGVGKGVERGLTQAVRELTAEELRRGIGRTIVKEVLKEAGGEATEEATDQLLQEAIVRWQYDPTQTLKGAAVNVLKAGALGGVAGGVIGGGPASVEAFGARRRAIQRQRAAPLPGEAPPKLGEIAGVKEAVEKANQPADVEAESGEAPKPAAEPPPGSTMILGRDGDGREVRVVVPATGGEPEVDRATEVLRRSVPGLVIDRIEKIEGGGSTEEAQEEGSEEVLTTEPAAPTVTVDSGVGQAQVDEAAAKSAGVQETITGQDEEIASEMPAEREERPAPAAPTKTRRNAGIETIQAIERTRPPDFIDWLEGQGWHIKSKKFASKATAPYYDNGYDDAKAGIGRKVFAEFGSEPDVVAQAAFDDLQIREPTIDALWEAIGNSRRGREDYRRRAFSENRQLNEITKQADRFTRADIEGRRAVHQRKTGVNDVLVDDLMPGDEFKVAGETFKVSGFEWDETDNVVGVVLDDGRKFGTQTVPAGTVLKVDGQSLAKTSTPQIAGESEPFSLGRKVDDDFFSGPESVEAQKARMAREAAEKKRRDDREEMLRRQAAPIVGRAVDTTGDMLDPLAGDAPLFQQTPKKPAPAKGSQGELFSVGEQPAKPIGNGRVRAVLSEILGPASDRIRVVNDPRWAHNGRLVRGVRRANGEIAINAAAVESDQEVAQVLREELLHSVWGDGQVRQAWNGILAAMDRAKREGKATAEGYTANVTEEAAIDEIEARVDRKGSLFRRFTDSIIKALYRRGHADVAGALFGTDRLADADAQALVGYALRLGRGTPEGDRFSLRSVNDDLSLRAKAGRAVTPLVSDLAHKGVALREEMGPAGETFPPWAERMVERYGEQVRPLLDVTWEATNGIRYALGNGLTPEAVEAIGRIEAHAENAPSPADRTPPPVYDPQKTAQWWMPFAKPSAVIRYFGGDDLLRKKQLLDMRTAYQAAAVKRQSDELWRQLEIALWGPKAKAIPRFLRPFWPKPKLQRFMRTALPVAGHLNVTGGTHGQWQFADFEMRAGFITESEAGRQGIGTGDTIMRAHPMKGALETLRLGPKIELESGAKGFQLIRSMPAAAQQGIYEWALQRFPEFQWFLDQWLDPALKDMRVTVNGVEVPVFNRHALATQYAQGDPKFNPREAYTPDVALGMGLLAAAQKFVRQRKVTFREGTVSPGRKYETGVARESGNVLDLLSGFNVRALQVLQEDVRKEWAQDVLSAAADVPTEGLPVGWTPIENAMAKVWEAVKTLRKFDDPINFPQVTDRLRDDASPAYQRFFGELMQLRNADKPKMLPAPLVDALVQQMQVIKEFGLLGKLAQVWAKNWKAFLLLMPDTFIENRSDNYLRFLMQGWRQLHLAALRGGDRLAFREARKLAWAGIVNMVPGVRPLFGLNNAKLSDEVVKAKLPPELFEGGTRLADLWTEKGTTQEEVASTLAMGLKGRAAGTIALNVGPLVLETLGYGKLDIAAKQQFAFTMLLAKAEHEAWRRGLRGDQAREFAEKWILQAPEGAVRRAVEGANRLLLNYSDTPGWLAKVARNPAVNLFVAFPLFRYHFVGREIDRATAAFRAIHRTLTRGKKLSRDEWASSLADTISWVTLPLAGASAIMIAGALKDSLLQFPDAGDDDDDDESRQLVGSSERIVVREDGTTTRKNLARELVTANRINVSRILRNVGIETGSPQDYWWHVKDYPIVRSAALMYAAMQDTRKHGPAQGFGTLMIGLKDFLTSIAGAGQALKVPIVGGGKALAALRGDTASQSWVDPYATAVPLDAYLTLQTLNLIPAQRQANEIVKWLDPIPRRVTASKSLDYNPGVLEAMQAEGWTALGDRIARGLVTGSTASSLPPQGTINRRFGIVEQPREFDLASRISAILGQNIKPIPRDEYSRAVTDTTP